MIIFYLLAIFENSLFPDFTINIARFNPGNFIEPKFLLAFGGMEKFGIDELKIYQVQIQNRPWKARLMTLGNELYRENLLELSGGFFIYKTWTAGIGIELLNNWIKDFTNRYTYSLKFGSSLSIPDLNFDFCINNINQPRFSNVDLLPLSYILGMKYDFNQTFQPYFFALGTTTRGFFLKTGAFFKFCPALEFSGGLNTENFQLEYCLRVHLRKIAFDYAGTNHRQLGLTHAFFINLVNP